jgi:starch synthase (maltosyl-transferring)
MSASVAARAPRIYSLPVELAGPLDDWPSWLAHIRAMGFSHILIPPPFLSGSVNGGSVLCDAERPHAALRSSASGGDTLRAIANLCAEHELGLLLDVDVASLAADAPLRVDHPDWFQAIAAFDGLPDPRQPPIESGVRWRLHDADSAKAALGWWSGRLRDWSRAGVAGFRLLSLDAAPAPWWAQLTANVRAQVPATVLLGWTQGLTPELLAPLAEAQFDFSFCSAEWWDFRASWFALEQQRLLRVAPPLACAATPFGGGAHHEPGDRAALERSHRRAAWFAAACAGGWLMPALFEFGAPDLALPAAAADPASASTDPVAAVAARGAFDLTEAIARINSWLAEHWLDASVASAQLLPAMHVGHGWVGLLRSTGDIAQLLLLNATLDRDVAADVALIDRGTASAFAPWRDADGGECDGRCTLAPGQVRVLHAARAAPVMQRAAAPVLRQRLALATQAPRIAIESVTPCVDDGRFPVKRVVGDRLRVEADVFMDGHDELAVSVRWRAIDQKNWHERRMQPLGNDRYAADFPLPRIGRYEYTVMAWRDAYATYHHEITVKHDAGVPIALELEEGRLLIEATANQAAPARRRALRALVTALGRDADDETRYRRLIADDTRAAMAEADPRPFAVAHPLLALEVDRRAAQFASWYELFPRSQTRDPARHGTFLDVIERLPAIQAMGFDVLYFPPIHPIGRAFRKGRNNTLTPAPDDPGSPYAIGSPEGGHTAIHPELGTLEDFRVLRDAAHAHGLELALDFAIQCSPDHPWLSEHPDWFDWRPDGSLRYAENPPKKYQDIVNVDFYTDGAIPSLWQALCDVVLFWAGEGVRTFRVDNPHTKPFPFWEWMIARVRERYPDTLFLAEAFTRPKPMYRLAKAGFNQSYTYFTWRHTKQEFIDYLTELTQAPPKDFFRPNFFVNTPDINPYFLQHSGRAGFLIRAALATTLSGLWGMYSGFELCEATPIPGKEEYFDSEKYEIRVRDWNMPGNIVAEITRLNAIRRAHPALQSHLGVRFLAADNDQVLFFEKSYYDGDRVLVAINLDPLHDQSSGLTLPLAEWGLPEDAALVVDDLLHDVTALWHGTRQHVWLGQGLPYAIWHVGT